MKITAILAMTNSCVIGNDNSLIWNIPEDLKRFRDLTTGNVVVMGKNTYFSLPEKFRPLPNRRNIVFTSEGIPGVECVASIQQLQKIIKNENRKIFLIGGAQLYNYFFDNNLVDDVELTLVQGNYDGNIKIHDFRTNFSELKRRKFSDGYFIYLTKNLIGIEGNSNI